MKKIIFIKLNNVKYGIWKDEILFIKSTEKIHKIPLMQESISIMCILEGNIANLADLSSCLGCMPISNNGPFSILVLSETNKLIGFVVNDILEDAELDNPKIIDFPEYFKHPIFDTCLLFKKEIIPILKINELFNNIRNGRIEPDLFKIAYNSFENRSVLKKLKHFEYNDEIFAVSSINLVDQIINPDFVCKLPLTPSHVKGITIYKEKIIPLIELSDYLHTDKKQKDDEILIYNYNGQNYGFLISNGFESKQTGEITCKEGDVKQLPYLVQSNWFKQASVQIKEIIPIINFDGILSNKPSNTSRKQFLEKYEETSLFKKKIFKEEITVVEFSILGSYHAIPDMEVNTIIPFTDITILSVDTSIVIGVTLFEDKILPILDLSICYGRKLELNETCKMILVENGNFQAFVVTDKVVGKNKLSVDEQKELTAYIQEPILYGCYIKENSVCLIFNILIMSIYFDREVVQEIFNKFARDFSETDSQKEETEEVSDKEDSFIEKEQPEISNNSIDEEKENIEEQDFKKPVDLNAGNEEESSDNVNINKEVPEAEEDNESSFIDKNKITVTEEDKIESANDKESPVVQKKAYAQPEQKKQKQGDNKKLFVFAALFIVAVIMIALIADIVNLYKTEETDSVNILTDDQNTEINTQVQEELDGEIDNDISNDISNEIDREAFNEMLIEINKEIEEKIEAQLIEDVKVFLDNEGISISLENIQFNPDSHELLADQLDELDRIVDILIKYPDKNILVVGHTAFNGTYISLQELSEERAQVVRNYLLSFNIWVDEQIAWRGMGPSQPVADNDTEAGMQRNRRVEIKILND